MRGRGNRRQTQRKATQLSEKVFIFVQEDDPNDPNDLPNEPSHSSQRGGRGRGRGGGPSYHRVPPPPSLQRQPQQPQKQQKQDVKPVAPPKEQQPKKKEPKDTFSSDKTVDADAFEKDALSFPWLKDLRSVFLPHLAPVSTSSTPPFSSSLSSTNTSNVSLQQQKGKNHERNQRRKEKQKERDALRRQEKQAAQLKEQSPQQQQQPKQQEKQQEKQQQRQQQPSTPSKKVRQKRSFFDPWIKESEAREGLMTGNLVSGTLRINKRKRRLAYVVAEGYEHDIVIIGSRDRNRGLQGDTVVVQVFGELKSDRFDDFKNGSDLLKENKKGEEKKVLTENEGGRVENSEASATKPEFLPSDSEDEDDNVVHPVAKVVYILERRPGQTSAGFLMPFDWKPGKNNVVLESGDEESQDGKVKDGKDIKMPHNIYFKPCDMRVPLFLVESSSCSPDFITNFKKYRDTLFVAKFRRWTENSMYPFGVLEKELGLIGNIMVETEAILESNSIRTQDFDKAISRALPVIPWTIPEDEILKRRDLRQERIFTIDPETARDLDDAVSCRVLPDGNYEIGVHIADVSHFVRHGTHVDVEAQKRATTTYLVQKAVPMLPGVLCENLCSLNPSVDRLAFSVIWKMTPEARILEAWYGRTVIRSCIKMSYENAQALIDNCPWSEAFSDGRDTTDGHLTSDVISDVKIFYKLSQIMRKARFDNGALTINQPKLTFRLDEDGYPHTCQVYEIRDSNRLIEEFMLLANMSVAQKISRHFPDASLLRCHPPPSAKVMDNFLQYTAKMGVAIDSTSAGSLQRSIQSIPNEEKRRIFQLLAIKPMQRAKYFCTGDTKSEVAWRHYALNVEMYTHFTSPIRRYADVIVHRLLQDALDEDLLLSGVEKTQEQAGSNEREKMVMKMSALARQCNVKKEDARAAQDASAKLYLCVYLSRLEEKSGRMVIVDAVVMDTGEKTFDVYVPSFAMDRRVYLEDCGVVRVEWPAERNKLTIMWPKVSLGIPPLDKRDEKKSPNTEDTTKKQFVEWEGSSEGGIVQVLEILSKVKIRLKVEGRSPLDVKAYLLRPDFVEEQKENVAEVEDLPKTGSHARLEEQYDEID